MGNLEKLKDLLIDVFLIKPEEFRFDLMRKEVSDWDSMAIITMVFGFEEVFGCRLRPEEAVAIRGVDDIVKVLKSKGVNFDE